MGTSLEDFAASHRPRRTNKPWLATIPEHDEIVASWQRGVTPSVIVQWLRDEKGYDEATIPKVGYYLRAYFPR